MIQKGGILRYLFAGSSNGRTQGFGPWYLGSSPSPATAMNNFREYYNPQILKTQGHELIDFLVQDMKQQLEGDKVLPYEKPETLLKFLEEQGRAHNPNSVVDGLKDISEKYFRNYAPGNLSHQVSVPSPASVLFTMTEAYFNTSTPSLEHSLVGNVIDRFVTNWLIKKVGYGLGADGILTSGATLGNLTALLTARAIQATDVWRSGTTEPLAVMVSEQAHYCIDRAVRTMGLGEKGIIKIPVGHDFAMDVTALEAAFAKATAEGVRVFAVIGSSCSTPTGSFDDLEAIADFCKKHNLWFHVDGAHGAAAVFSEKYRSLVNGIQRADSIVMDLHKMLMAPNIATAVLYKNGSDSYKTFSQDAHYLFSPESDASYDFGLRTYECTKPATGMRVYGVLKLYGEDFFKDYVEHVFDITKEFAGEIKRMASLELLTEPQCNIVCFRKTQEGANLDELNREIKGEILSKGNFIVSSTVIQGKFYLRVTIMNPLTTKETLSNLIKTIL